MKKILFGIISLSLILNPYVVFADEVTVSGNAEGSTNNVNVNVVENTTVEQTNEADIQNDVDVEADTGNNNANENLGEVEITTGDIEVDTKILNEDINQSYVDTGCCSDGLDLNIKENGTNSNNTINYSTQKNTDVSITQTASINNSIYGIANTGENKANKNLGDVSIESGNITVTDKIENTGINVHDVSAANGTGGSVYISVDGNADDSTNSVNYSNESNVNISIVSTAVIVNDTKWDLNTGRNVANGNLGNVNISTGDIYYSSSIKNGPVNYGWVDIDCCGGLGDTDGGGIPDPTPPPAASPPPGNSSNSHSSNGPGSSSSEGGSNSHNTLPITGAPSLLFWGIASVLMFFLGWYLRLRSGRSPNFAI